MKHYSPSALEGLASLARPLLSDADLKARIRERLEDLDRKGWALANAKGKVAADLGINQAELTRMLRGQMGITPSIAAKLGYRAVTRFEKIDP